MDETKPSGGRGEDPARPYEERDVTIRPIVTFGVGLVVLTGVVLVLMSGMFQYFAGRQAKREVPAPSLAEAPLPPPEPRLQVAPGQDAKEMRAAEEAVLESYGWADREAGIVRIPIDRAIELLLERGLPVRSKIPPEAESKKS